jgi:hypothetical protein
MIVAIHATNAGDRTMVAHTLVETINANERWLDDNAPDIINETTELWEDAFDLLGHFVPSEKEFFARSMAFCVYHVLLPITSGIKVNLLAGNIPACFMELRLVFESLVKCYAADVVCSDQPFFQQRLEFLEETERNITRLTEMVGNTLGADDKFTTLWRSLSNNWVHTGGYVKNVVKSVTEKAHPPSWALNVPRVYAPSDLDALVELRDELSAFRHLQRITMEGYQREVGFPQK